MTLSVASTMGQPSHEPSTTVTANADGAFAANYVPVVLCGEAGSQFGRAGAWRQGQQRVRAIAAGPADRLPSCLTCTVTACACLLLPR